MTNQEMTQEERGEGDGCGGGEMYVINSEPWQLASEVAHDTALSPLVKLLLQVDGRLTRLQTQRIAL